MNREDLMSDDIVRKTSAPVAANIWEVAEQSGKLDVADVNWGVATALNSEVKKAIVSALTPDLYIEPGEERSILMVTPRDERRFVQALLDHLRENSPRQARIGYLEGLLAKPGCSRFVSWFFLDCEAYADQESFRQELHRLLKPLDDPANSKASCP